MRSILCKASLGLLLGFGFGQQLANASVISLTDGVEVIETFSSATPSYQFVIQNAITVGFSMAFAGTDQYQIQFTPGPNSSLGTFPTLATRSGGTSTFILGAIAANAGFTSGSLNITVTDLNPSGISLAGFEYSSTGALTLPIPIAAAVPEPSTWAMIILGFAGVGFMAYRRRHQSMSLSAA